MEFSFAIVWVLDHHLGLVRASARMISLFFDRLLLSSILVIFPSNSSTFANIFEIMWMNNAMIKHDPALHFYPSDNRMVEEIATSNCFTSSSEREKAEVTAQGTLTFYNKRYLWAPSLHTLNLLLSRRRARLNSRWFPYQYPSSLQCLRYVLRSTCWSRPKQCSAQQ